MTQPKKILDIHTHLMNARYLPIKEIFESKGVPKFISPVLAKLVLAMTKSSLSHLNNKLNEPQTSFISTQVNQINSELMFEEMLDFITQDVVLGIEVEQSRNKKIFQNHEESLVDAIDNINDLFGDSETNKLINELKNKHQVSYDKGLRFSLVKRLLKRLFIKVMEFVETGVDFIDFVRVMMSSEQYIFNRVNRYYKHIDHVLIAHQMLDFDRPFGGESKWDFYEEQIPLMQKLEESSGGMLIGFSCYDPFRFIGKTEEYITERLQYALAHGKVGFKVYPPMGFKAVDNDDELIKEPLEIFYKFCLEYDVPIFTHCTPHGFEVKEGSGKNSHPEFWERLLIKYPKLRLCLAHAGGIDGWLEDDEGWINDDNYSMRVSRLCVEYENVYCDLAHLDEIIGNKQKKNKLKNRLEKVVHEFPEFGKKVMFGTDWHMPLMVNDINKYFSELVDIFSNGELAKYHEQFFCLNAIKYLNLGEYLKRDINMSQSYKNRINEFLTDTK